MTVSRYQSDSFRAQDASQGSYTYGEMFALMYSEAYTARLEAARSQARHKSRTALLNDYPQAGKADMGLLNVDATGLMPHEATSSNSNREFSTRTRLTPLEQVGAFSLSPASNTSSPSPPRGALLPPAHASPPQLAFPPSEFTLPQKPFVTLPHDHTQAAYVGNAVAGPYEPSLQPSYGFPQGGPTHFGSMSGRAAPGIVLPAAHVSAPAAAVPEPRKEVAGPRKGGQAPRKRTAQGLGDPAVSQKKAKKKAKKTAKGLDDSAQLQKKLRIEALKACAPCQMGGACGVTVNGKKCIWGNHFNQEHEEVCSYMTVPTEEEKSVKRWKCIWPECVGKTFCNEAGLGEHVLNKHLGQAYLCPVCPMAKAKPCSKTSSFTRHLKNQHGLVLVLVENEEEAGPSM